MQVLLFFPNKPAKVVVSVLLVHLPERLVHIVVAAVIFFGHAVEVLHLVQSLVEL